MKSLLFLLCLSAPFIGISQNVDARVQQIRKMYGEANTQFEANRDRCDIVSEPYVEDLGFGPYETTHTFRYCILEQGYTVLEAAYEYYEAEAKTVFYFKDGQLFFVYAYSAGEACEQEERFYFSSTEKPIRYLLRSNDCEGSELGNNKEVFEYAERFNELMQEYQDIRPYFFND